jgi:hypothetical protein
VSEETPRSRPSSEGGEGAADDPARQRPPDAGGTETQSPEQRPIEVEQAHGEAIAAGAADHVARREAEQAVQEADEAREEAEKLSRKERKAREKAEKEREKAEEERRKADEATRREEGEAMAAAAEADVRAASGDAVTAVGTHEDPSKTESSVSGATITGAGVGTESAPRAQAAAATSATAAQEPQSSPPPPPEDDRPEVIIGAAFAGAFVFAKVLRRVTRG